MASATWIDQHGPDDDSNAAVYLDGMLERLAFFLPIHMGHDAEIRAVKALRRAAQVLVALLDEVRVDKSHGFPHSVAVVLHCAAALEDVPHAPVLPVLLAALLHDADDRKIFASDDHANARAILRRVAPDMEDQVIRMIALVSCAENGNTVPAGVEPWMLLPRDADRLEALGDIGIARCYEFTVAHGKPLYTCDTPRPKTDAELDAVATPERFAAYQRDKLASASMMDHYLDKLLHIGVVSSGSAYMYEQARRRMRVMRDFVIAFGINGQVDEAALHKMRCDLLGHTPVVEQRDIDEKLRKASVL